MKPLHAQYLFCCATLSLLSPWPALAWSDLTVFGDSLSDGGNVGRFTYDGATHPLYDEILAQSLGDNLRPSSQGGNNYAEGGAVAVPAINPLFNTQDQLDSYLAARGGRADPDGLYIHWIGGNDLAAAALAPLAAQQIVDNSASAAASQVSRLLDAGAGTVIVPTVPNVGRRPRCFRRSCRCLARPRNPLRPRCLRRRRCSWGMRRIRWMDICSSVSSPPALAGSLFSAGMPRSSEISVVIACGMAMPPAPPAPWVWAIS